ASTSGSLVPEGQPLTDSQLEETKGEWAHIAAGAIVSLGMFALNNWDEEKDVDWYVRAATATITGAVTAGTGGALVKAFKSQAAKAVAMVYSGGKQGTIEWALGKE